MTAIKLLPKGTAIPIDIAAADTFGGSSKDATFLGQNAFLSVNGFIGVSVFGTGASAGETHFSATVGFAFDISGASKLQLGTGSLLVVVPLIDFHQSQNNCKVTQVATNSGAGKPLVFQAQGTTDNAKGGLTSIRGADNTGVGTGTGGDAIFAPGSGPGGNGEAQIANSANDPFIRVNSTGGAFFNTAPIAKPTVTGSRVANPALASLLSQLAALGLITDSTTI